MLVLGLTRNIRDVRYRIWLIFLIVLFSNPTYSKSNFFKFEHRPYRPMVADQSEVKFDWIILNNNRINTTIGSNFPFYNYYGQALTTNSIKKSNKNEEGNNRMFVLNKHFNAVQKTRHLQAGLSALGFNRLHYKGGFSFDLNSYDAIFGPYVDYRRKQFSYSLRFLHISTHLSEGVLKNKREKFSVFRYSREFFIFLISYDWYFLRVYGGPSYVALLSTPANLKKNTLTGFQFGIEYELYGFNYLQPYFAIDLQAKAEHNFFISKSIAFGIKFTDIDNSLMSLRLQFQYYAGKDPRGNFFLKQTEYFGVGLAIFL